MQHRLPSAIALLPNRGNVHCTGNLSPIIARFEACFVDDDGGFPIWNASLYIRERVAVELKLADSFQLLRNGTNAGAVHARVIVCPQLPCLIELLVFQGLPHGFFFLCDCRARCAVSGLAPETAQRARALDPATAEAHHALGMVSLWGAKDWASAEREFQQAINLKPNYARVYDEYAWLLGELGRFDEAVAYFNRGLELDPLSLPLNADLGQCYYWMRRYDQALAQLRKTLELDSSFPITNLNLAAT